MWRQFPTVSGYFLKQLRRRRCFLRTVFLAAFLFSGCAALKQCAYEGLSRDDWQRPDKVIQSLQIRPGDSIADLGAGSGYFTFRLVHATGPTGKVYAVDIDKDMAALLAKKAKDLGAHNVEIILAKPDDSLLPESSVDLIFTSNTFHHIENRVAYFTALRKALRPNGRLAIIEFDQRSWFSWLGHHYTPSEIIKREMEQAGFRLTRDFDFLDRQSFLLFERR
jgi:arsenite methyltransferase